MAFSNLAQAMSEDRAAVDYLKISNITLTNQVALYANRPSTKDADNMALQTAMKNLQGEVKNSRPKSPPSRGQDTPAATAPPSRTGEYRIKSGREMDKPTTQPSGALHTVGYMGQEAI